MQSATESPTVGGTLTSSAPGGATTVAQTDETDFQVWGVLGAGVVFVCGALGALLGVRFGRRRPVRTDVGEAGE
jgi:hypothetical protein